MVILNAPTGRAKVTLTGSELLEVLGTTCQLQHTAQQRQLTEAVFVDAQAGARAPVNIVDSILATVCAQCAIDHTHQQTQCPVQL
jgi:hypothetical protein